MSQSHEDLSEAMVDASLRALSIQANDLPERAVSPYPDDNATIPRHLPNVNNHAESQRDFAGLDTSLQIANDPQGSIGEVAGIGSHGQYASEYLSAFLSLPIEIRDMILKNIFGGRKVFVRSECISSQYVQLRSKNDWAKYSLRYTFRPQSMIRKSQSSTSSPYPSEYIYIRGQLLCPMSIDKPRHDVDNRLVAMLLVCKQLSAESLNMFYKTNIFSFEDPTSFHIFVSRLSSTRASLLRRIELIAEDDNQALGSLIARGILAAPPHFWRLGGNDLKALAKLTSVTHIKICVSVNGLRSPGTVWDFGRTQRASHVNRWLRYVFGGLHAVRSLRRLEIDIACRDDFPLFTRTDHLSYDEMIQATLSSIIDEFKREVLNDAGSLT